MESSINLIRSMCVRNCGKSKLKRQWSRIGLENLRKQEKLNMGYDGSTKYDK